VLLDAEGTTVLRLLDRKSLLKRVAAGREHEVQPLAANVDVLFVVSACNEEFNPSRIERYLALAMDAGVEPVVVLTKADHDRCAGTFVDAVRALKRDVAVELVDARDPAALDGVRAWCRVGRTVALLGSSGVGKSTLVNSLAAARCSHRGGREDDAKGRHTTTQRSLHRIAGRRAAGGQSGYARAGADRGRCGPPRRCSTTSRCWPTAAGFATAATSPSPAAPYARHWRGAISIRGGSTATVSCARMRGTAKTWRRAVPFRSLGRQHRRIRKRRPARAVRCRFGGHMSNLHAPRIRRQGVSVTRKMAASLPGLRKLAQEKGLKIHHLGAGYPHPEVTDPRGFLAHQAAYFQHLEQAEGLNDPAQLPEYLRESFSYTDTLGPVTTRQAFARVYGRDWGVDIDPDKLIPTVGASGGISLICSLFERPGTPVAYITDAPTYAGFLARAGLCQHARIFSVEMDEQGPLVARLREQIRAARAAGYDVPFYYTVPDGHNPAGFSFSQRRREAVVAVAREEGVLIVEDAPYLYINYAEPARRPQPFLAWRRIRPCTCSPARRSAFPVRGWVFCTARRRSPSAAARRRRCGIWPSPRPAPTSCSRTRARCAASRRCCTMPTSVSGARCGTWRKPS
jgi:energy-coupling factor transporter ATP-binding protein EcfA2